MLAIITGAYGGLGSELSKGLWDAGYDLMLIGKNQSKLSALKRELKVNAQQNCCIKVCDLSNLTELSSFISDEIDILSSVSVLINNAAIHGEIGYFIDNDINQLREVFEVNFFAPAAFCKAVYPIMAAKQKGSIINISGGGATSSRPMFSSYGSSKTALVRFSETIADEFLEVGIRVNCIAPGMMKTKLLAEVLDQGPDKSGRREYDLAKKVFSKKCNSLSRVVELVLFLSSDASKGISGKLISAMWDSWEDWMDHLDDLKTTDLYTLRRITGRDRDMSWGDK